jgi:succinyl-diaminopimelate desuccinylase
MTPVPSIFRDVVALTQAMVRVDTVNPPGNESHLCDLLELPLRQLGFTTERHPMGPGRDNLIAFPADLPRAMVCFSGHLDTVPFGLMPWSEAPLGGVIQDGKLYGRGASDMKGGIAAFLVAIARVCSERGSPPPVLIVLTAGEETGCEGATALLPLRGRGFDVRAVLIAEPTWNRMAIGHKGAVWLRAEARGRAAHGSMPELGDNAIYHAAEAILKIRQFEVTPGFDALLGKSSVNVGTVSGGTNVNSVPDRARFEIDLRTVGTSSRVGVPEDVQAYLGSRIKIRTIVDVPPLATNFNDAWIATVATAVQEITGKVPDRETVAYFTDGPALQNIFGPVPTAILGPGTPACAHMADEYCETGKLVEAVRIYQMILQSPYLRGAHDAVL